MWCQDVVSGTISPHIPGLWPMHNDIRNGSVCKWKKWLYGVSAARERPVDVRDKALRWKSLSSLTMLQRHIWVAITHRLRSDVCSRPRDEKMAIFLGFWFFVCRKYSTRTYQVTHSTYLDTHYSFSCYALCLWRIESEEVVRWQTSLCFLRIKFFFCLTHLPLIYLLFLYVLHFAVVRAHFLLCDLASFQFIIVITLVTQIR